MRTRLQDQLAEEHQNAKGVESERKGKKRKSSDTDLQAAQKVPVSPKKRRSSKSASEETPEQQKREARKNEGKSTKTTQSKPTKTTPNKSAGPEGKKKSLQSKRKERQKESAGNDELVQPQLRSSEGVPKKKLPHSSTKRFSNALLGAQLEEDASHQLSSDKSKHKLAQHESNEDTAPAKGNFGKDTGKETAGMGERDEATNPESPFPWQEDGSSKKKESGKKPKKNSKRPETSKPTAKKVLDASALEQETNAEALVSSEQEEENGIAAEQIGKDSDEEGPEEVSLHLSRESVQNQSELAARAQKAVRELKLLTKDQAPYIGNVQSSETIANEFDTIQRQKEEPIDDGHEEDKEDDDDDDLLPENVIQAIHASERFPKRQKMISKEHRLEQDNDQHEAPSDDGEELNWQAGHKIVKILDERPIFRPSASAKDYLRSKLHGSRIRRSVDTVQTQKTGHKKHKQKFVRKGALPLTAQ